MPRSANRQRRPKDQVGQPARDDPFELIRWLARSQPDPRKALAELVQIPSTPRQERNVTRLRERGVTVRQVLARRGRDPRNAATRRAGPTSRPIGHSQARSPRSTPRLCAGRRYRPARFWRSASVGERSRCGKAPGPFPHVEDSPRYGSMVGSRPRSAKLHRVRQSASCTGGFASMTPRRSATTLLPSCVPLLARASDLVHDRIRAGRRRRCGGCTGSLSASDSSCPKPSKTGILGSPSTLRVLAARNRRALSISCTGTVVSINSGRSRWPS